MCRDRRPTAAPEHGIDDMLDSAGSRLASGQAVDAALKYRDALHHACAAGAAGDAASACVGVGAAMLALGRLASAGRFFRLAERMCSSAGDEYGAAIASGNLGLVYRLSGEPAAAKPLIERAIRANDREGDPAAVAQWEAELGLCHRAIGERDAGRSVLESSMAHACQAGSAEDQGVAQLYLALLDLDSGNTERASARLESVLQTRSGGTPDALRGAVLANLGVAYRDLRRLEEAATCLAESFALFTRIDDQRNLARVATDQGNLLLEWGDAEGALHALEQAVVAARRTGLPALLAAALSNQGRAEEARSEHAKAVELYRAALELCRTHRLVSLEPVVRCNLGESELHLRLMDQGLSNLRQAAVMARAGGQWDARWRSHWLLAHHCARQGAWKCALRRSIRAIDCLERRRSTFVADTSREFMLADNAGLYEMGVEAAVQAGARDLAFRWSELQKSRLLTEVLALGDALPTGCPPGLLARWQKIRDALRATAAPVVEGCLPRAAMAAPSRTEAGGGAGGGPWALHQQYEQVLAEVHRYDPQFATLAADGRDVYRGALAALPEDGASALVQLVITERGTAAFVLRKGDARPSSENVLWIDAYNATTNGQLIAGASSGDSCGQWQELLRSFQRKPDVLTGFQRQLMHLVLGRVWRLLMAPLHERLFAWGIRRVLMVPHRTLRILPLHATWRGPNDQPRFAIDDYEVSYLPSASSLTHCSRLVRERPEEGGVLVVEWAPNLGCVSREVEAVIAAAGHRRVVRLFGRDATVEKVLQSMDGMRHVHFVCHGVYDWDQPLQSRLELYDGPLTLGRIRASRRLGASRLVTVSACESGLSSPVGQADEYVGFPSGFLLAGAPAAVSTLWAVDDQATAALMASFYGAYLAGGLPLAEALRRAQIATRGTPGGRYAHPYFWAGVGLFGV